MAQVNQKDSIRTSGSNKGDIIIEISPNIIHNSIAGSRFAGGLNFEYFISKRVNFNGYLFIGNGFGHLNPGILTLPGFLLLRNINNATEFTSLADLLIEIILFATAFENPSIHFPVSANSDFSLNVSPLRIKWDNYSKSADQNNEAQLAFAAGIRYNRYFGRFVLSPYGEFCFGYSDFTPGINAGIHFGLYIPNR